jgi:hypothetical protein
MKSKKSRNLGMPIVGLVLLVLVSILVWRNLHEKNQPQPISAQAAKPKAKLQDRPKKERPVESNKYEVTTRVQVFQPTTENK